MTGWWQAASKRVIKYTLEATNFSLSINSYQDPKLLAELQKKYEAVGVFVPEVPRVEEVVFNAVDREAGPGLHQTEEEVVLGHLMGEVEHEGGEEVAEDSEVHNLNVYTLLVLLIHNY